MKIILISGKAGSGKDEVASMIQKKLQNSIITSYSKYIKLFAIEMSSWTGHEDTKPRTLLQDLGTELRSIDENFLTKRLTEDLKVYEKHYNYVIISDVRLVNEIEYLKKNSNYEIVTIRINSETYKRELTEIQKQHQTEIELDNYNEFDYLINNNFDADLEIQIESIMKGLT